MTDRNSKFLTSKQEIMDYIGVSDYLFAKFVKRNMPALCLDGRWYAHADNLDDFLKKITFVSSKNAPEDML